MSGRSTRLRSNMKSNLEWIDWGKRDPLFGTAAWPGRERGGNHPWTDEDFYALGRSDWADFLRHWEAYGLDRSTCLEIGCGPGRLTRGIAVTFDHVDALDVSAEMVAYASAHVDDDNVTFHTTDGLTVPIPDGTVASVFSAHVFQHLDSSRDAAAYFREIFRVLVPTGSMMIHLPLHTFPFSKTKLAALSRGLYRVKRAVGDLRACYNRGRLRFGRNVQLMRGMSFEIEWLMSTLAAIGFKDLEFATFATQSNGAFHSCLLARKPTPHDQYLRKQ